MLVKGNRLSPNPFDHKIKLTLINKIQIAFMSVFIFPIRFMVAMSCVGLVCFFCFVATLSLPNVAVRPMYGWRKKLGIAVRVLLRVMFFFTSIHRIKVFGKENLKKGIDPDIVIASPHSSFFDPILLFAFEELPTGISRIENIELFILGRVTKYFSPISVVRDNPDSRKQTITEIKRRVNSRVKYYQNLENGIEDENNPQAMNWPPLFSFPEGTTGNGKYLMKFKYGAFIPGHPVQPVFLRYHNAMDTMTWTWIGPSLYKILWLTLCQFHTTACITILPLYTPSSQEKLDAKLFANNVREVIANEMQVGTVDMDYTDSDIFIYLSKLSIRPLDVMVRLNRELKKIHFRSNFCVTTFVEKNFLSSSCFLDSLWRNGPVMNKAAFVEALNHLEHTPFVRDSNQQSIQSDDFFWECNETNLAPTSDGGNNEFVDRVNASEIFDACLEEGEREIDIRKFLLWLCLCSYPQETYCIVKLAFKLYSHPENKGNLTKPQMAEVLQVLYQLTEADLEVVLKELFSYSNQLTFGSFRAYSKNQGTKKFKRFQRIFGRFFLEKRQLMKLPPGDYRDDVVVVS